MSRWKRFMGGIRDLTDRIPTDGPLSRKDQREWSQAESVADLRELTARWLEGDIETCPGYYGRPDSETKKLIPTLVAMNRSGLLTIGSQPGEGPVLGYDGNMWWQRAAIEGITDQATADRINTARENTDLLMVQHHGAGRFCDYRSVVDVTASGDNVHTNFGTRLSKKELGFHFDGLAYDELCSAEQVVVVDPVWGRNNLLWKTVTDSLTLEREIPEQVTRERIEIGYGTEERKLETENPFRNPSKEELEVVTGSCDLYPAEYQGTERDSRELEREQ